MRIGVDVMGGDNAPDEILKGIALAAENLPDDVELYLCGPESLIREMLSERDVDMSQITIVNTTEIIDMAEPPVEAVRTKKDSSLVVLNRLASKKAEKPLDAIISAGNTGACVSAAQMFMRRLPNVHRPGIAVTVPTFNGPVALIDVGANIEPKPHHLAQYGIMGEIYAKQILGVERPRVALMNVGGEEQKGTADMKLARDLLRSVPDMEFKGYIEGRGVFDGEADVVITEAVVGNVMLKLAEGLSSGIFKALATELLQIDPDLALRLDPVVKSLYSKYDYHEYGGAPLLGVNGVCLISHGSSVGRTINNAITHAMRFVRSGVNDAITQRLASMEEVPA